MLLQVCILEYFYNAICNSTAMERSGVSSKNRYKRVTCLSNDSTECISKGKKFNMSDKCLCWGIPAQIPGCIPGW